MFSELRGRGAYDRQNRMKLQVAPAGIATAGSPMAMGGRSAVGGQFASQSSGQIWDGRASVQAIDSSETMECNCAAFSVPLSLQHRQSPAFEFASDCPDQDTYPYSSRDLTSSASASASTVGVGLGAGVRRLLRAAEAEPTEQLICWHHLCVARSRKSGEVRIMKIPEATADRRLFEREEELLHDTRYRVFGYSFCPRYVDPAFSDAVRPTVIDNSLSLHSRSQIDTNKNASSQSSLSNRNRTTSVALKNSDAVYVNLPAAHNVSHDVKHNRGPLVMNTSDRTGSHVPVHRQMESDIFAGRLPADSFGQKLRTSSKHNQQYQKLPTTSTFSRAREMCPDEHKYCRLLRLPPLPPPSNLIQIRILHSEIGFKGVKSHVDEWTPEDSKDSLLSYESRPFEWRVELQVAVLNTPGRWLIGFIQGCVAMHCEHVYGSSGSTWWEFNELSHGRRTILNDSDGTAAPWYGGNLGQNLVSISNPLGILPANWYKGLPRMDLKTRLDIKNGMNAQFGKPFTLQMSDCFSPAICWDRPVNYSRGYEATLPPPPLTSVRRSQRFIVWLALYDTERNTYYGLKTVKWSYTLELAIDATRSFKRRIDSVVLVRDNPSFEVLQKPDADRLVRIPAEVVMPPYANACQSLVWRPRHRSYCSQRDHLGHRCRKSKTCYCDLHPVLVVQPTQQLATWPTWEREMLHEPCRDPIESSRCGGDCPFFESLIQNSR